MLSRSCWPICSEIECLCPSLFPGQQVSQTRLPLLASCFSFPAVKQVILEGVGGGKPRGSASLTAKLQHTRRGAASGCCW